MKNIARLPKEERLILFRNTAANCGLSEGIVEKDFWVCWRLWITSSIKAPGPIIWHSKVAPAFPKALI